MDFDDNGEGAPVVLLHGQPGDRRDWDRVVEVLDGGVRTIVPDRPGYGRTVGPAGGVGTNRDAVLGLLDGLRLDRVVVAGFSWAGAVALDLALSVPDRVGGVVLVSSVGGPGSVDELDKVLAAPVVGPLLALSGLAMLSANRVRRFIAPRAAPGDPSALERLPARWLGSWRSFVTEERALLSELAPLTARLGSVRAPAVVLVGEADRVVRPHSQEQLAAALPDAELRRVPGCGHLLPHEAPRVVAGAILDVAERMR